MIFNVWLGGEQVNIGRVYDAIRAAKADIVLLQEPEGQTRAFAATLGYPYASERHHIISQYPRSIRRPPMPTSRSRRSGPAVSSRSAISTDLRSLRPGAVRDGKTAEEVLKIETDTRLPEIGLTSRAVAARDERRAGLHRRRLQCALRTSIGRRPCDGAAAGALPLEWPVSKRWPNAGFRDSYREINPDPVAIPITWTSGYPVRIATPTRPSTASTRSTRSAIPPPSPARSSARPAARHRYRDHALAVGHHAVVSTFKAFPARRRHDLARTPGGDGRRAAALRFHAAAARTAGSKTAALPSSPPDSRPRRR